MSTTVGPTITPAPASPLTAAMENKLILGPFPPLQEGAWSPSSAPRETSWTYEYNARCAIESEKYGACIDHISGGRWGLNVVTGYRRFGERVVPLMVEAGPRKPGA